jgi:hypothetical protein
MSPMAWGARVLQRRHGEVRSCPPFSFTSSSYYTSFCHILLFVTALLRGREGSLRPWSFLFLENQNWKEIYEIVISITKISWTIFSCIQNTPEQLIKLVTSRLKVIFKQTFGLTLIRKNSVGAHVDNASWDITSCQYFYSFYYIVFKLVL